MPNNKNNRPKFNEYHQSIARELWAVKDKIRNLVQHWGTDGSWKEAALRAILRKHLPESCIVGQGFVVGPKRASTQIDVLVVSRDQPTLFKDGDLLIVTPSAVRAIIEVKTKLPKSVSKKPFVKLAENVALCEQHGNHNVWSGLFDFDSLDDKSFRSSLLKAIKRARDEIKCPVNCVACGRKLFIRHWKKDARDDCPENLWRLYRLVGLAPSYFIGNLINHISSVDNQTDSYAWFPIEGTKEVNQVCQILEDNNQIQELDGWRNQSSSHGACNG